MNYIDIILLIPIIWFAYQGFKRGFVVELASLVALILGIYAALYFSGYAVAFLQNNFNIDPDYVPVIAFIITFIIVVVIVHFAGKLLEKIINLVAMGFLNKLAGGIFGVLKAAVFLSILILIINHFSDDLISNEKKKGSMLYPPVEAIAPTLWDKFKDWDIENSQIKELQDAVDETTI